jgi:hypothetical protein
LLGWLRLHLVEGIEELDAALRRRGDHAHDRRRRRSFVAIDRCGLPPDDRRGRRPGCCRRDARR